MSELRVYNSREELYRGANIATEYCRGAVNGWLGEDRAAEEFNLLRNQFLYFPNFLVAGAAGKKQFLYRFVRKAIGSDTKNYPQQIGDCVSFGAKNAVEYLICTEKAVNGIREDFHPIFPPYIYGTSRVQVGGGRLGNEDGSLGSWAAQSVMKYGILAADDSGVPAYSGQVAKTWGRSPGPAQNFLDIASKRPVKSAAQIKSWEELVAAIVNGYPCTVASNQGFAMEADSSGFHQAKGQWGHQLCARANTIIKSNTNKEIQFINIGDDIYGADGKLHKVTNVFKREINEDMICIKGCGTIPLYLTKNHPVLILRLKESDIQIAHGIDINSYINSVTTVTTTKNRQLIWVESKDIMTGDYLVCPWPQLSSNEKSPEELPVNDDIAWMLGLYAADGSGEKSHKISFVLGSHQEKEIQRLINCIIQLGFKANVRNFGKYTRIKLFSAKLANKFISWFDKKTNKHLPEWIFNGDWNLKEVLQGIFDGDGNYNNKQKCIVNTSLNLIYQTHSILLSLGEKPYITKRTHNSEYAKNWSDIYVIMWTENSQRPGFNYWDNTNYAVKVKEISTEHYEGNVYNLEVEKAESYIANGVAVHNCIIGADDEYQQPYALILNSWGDVHGHLKSFDGQDDIPVGVIRAKKDVVVGMINQGETFAYSNFDGFPAQDLDEALFKIV